jgi:hypothetical protein
MREQERMMAGQHLQQQQHMISHSGGLAYGMDPMSMQMNGVSMNGNAMGGMGGMPAMTSPAMGMNGMNMNMGMPMQMQMPPYMQQNGMMPYPNMYANPAAQMSMGYLPQMPMQMGMPMGMPMGMMPNAMGMAPPAANMSTPNFGAQQGTYAAYAQQQMGGQAGALDMMELRPEQRDVIDRWRQGVL